MTEPASAKDRALPRFARAVPRWLVVAVALVAALPIAGSLPAAARADGATIYYHDPDVNLAQAERFEKKIDRWLGQIDPSVRLRAFSRLGLLRQALRKEPPDFVMIPPYLARELGAADDLRPLLIRQRRRSSFQEFIVVGAGDLAGLRGETLAATGAIARPTVLDGLLLTGTGIRSTELRTLQVKKDVDAVLAAGRGQVAGACVAKRTFDLVLRANSALRGKLKTMHTIKNVPLTALCAYKSPDPAKVRAVEELFGQLHRSRAGKNVLRMWKADRMTPVDDQLRKRLIP